MNHQLRVKSEAHLRVEVQLRAKVQVHAKGGADRKKESIDGASIGQEKNPKEKRKRSAIIKKEKRKRSAMVITVAGITEVVVHYQIVVAVEKIMVVVNQAENTDIIIIIMPHI